MHSTLIKFGRCDHLEALRDDGVLYMNTLEYFWSVEDDDARGDPYDCNTSIHHGKSGTVEIPTADGRTIVGKVSNFEYRVHTAHPDQINLFCMYAIRPAFGSFPIDARNLRFGEHALVFLQPQEFIDRTRQAIRESGRGGRAGLVEYVPEDYAGEIGPFRKKSRFRYQSEWRLVVENGPGTALRMQVGSLCEIAVIVRAEEINTVVRVDS